MTQLNLSVKQKQTQIEHTCGCQGRVWGRDTFGDQYQQMQTIIYRMDKQKGPTVQGTLQYPVKNHNGKEYENEYIYN